ncbi:hypothetical protein SESBI_24166 [Sesbania bispinosa]|nr:hypothetical protein SESBI_24166 [Sesbania bispinosa]
MTLRYRKSAKGYAQLEQDMVKLTQTFPQEQLQAMGKDDILSRALGVPEHPDRVRVAGVGVSQRSIFGPLQSTPQQQWTDWQLRAQQWMMQISQWATQISRGQVQPFVSMPGQPPSVPMPGQPASAPMPGQPASVLVPSQSPSMSVPGGVTLNTMSLPPGHHKVSVDVVQSHGEDSPLPILIEDENLMTIRDAIATYVAWPRSLITLPPWVPPPSSKGKGKEHFQTKESITSLMKGSVHCIIPKEFAGAKGILAFKNLRIMVQGDVLVHVVENTYSKDYCGKEFKDEIGTDEIIEVITTNFPPIPSNFNPFQYNFDCEM